MSRPRPGAEDRLTLFACRGGLLVGSVVYEPPDGFFLYGPDHDRAFLGSTALFARRRLAQMRAMARRQRWRDNAAWRDSRAKAIGEVVLSIAAKAAPVAVDFIRNLAGGGDGKLP